MSIATSSLPQSFFARSTVEVARDLIGTMLFASDGEDTVSGRIVEVEAYGGDDDPASHAARGMTRRSAIMFGPAGLAYVYLIYGMHHCLNVVTDSDGSAGAVLIRAVEPYEGLPVMARRRFGVEAFDRRGDLAGGPGRLCRAFGIDLECNGLSLCTARAGETAGRVWVGAPVGGRPTVVATPRVGIRVAKSRLHRFVDRGSDCLSRPLQRDR